MIGNCTSPVRYEYLVKTNDKKNNNQPLTPDDYMNVGFMAGRFGYNLQNPNDPNNIYKDQSGSYMKINSCCAPLFEENLNKAGIRFNRLA